jgi:hypothetical protein
MKAVFVIAMSILSSCAHYRETKISNVAQDSMAQGLIHASILKENDGYEVCFDISLRMKGVTQKDASTSNWTAAVVDEDSRYHLLSLTQRDPASVPKGGPEEWSNSFRTCALHSRIGTIKSLVLTPKTLPYPETEGMTVEWK